MTRNEYQVSKQAVLANGSYSTLHTVNCARWMRVANIHLANTGATDQTVRLCRVISGGAAGTSNALLYDFTVPANDFIEFGEGLMLGPKDSLQGSADAANAIVATLGGVEFGGLDAGA